MDLGITQWARVITDQVVDGECHSSKPDADSQWKPVHRYELQTL